MKISGWVLFAALSASIYNFGAMGPQVLLNNGWKRWKQLGGLWRGWRQWCLGKFFMNLLKPTHWPRQLKFTEVQTWPNYFQKKVWSAQQTHCQLFGLIGENSRLYPISFLKMRVILFAWPVTNVVTTQNATLSPLHSSASRKPVLNVIKNFGKRRKSSVTLRSNL